MGEAKRKQAAIGKVIETMVEPVSGAKYEVRVGGPLGRFLEEFSVRVKDDATAHVPCNGCTACCRGHYTIDVDCDEEDPEHLKHLDLVQDPKTGKTVLRQKVDGSCVHLGQEGCTVRDHRPSECRTYDCRVMSAISVREIWSEGKNHNPPHWEFDMSTTHEKAIGGALWMASVMTHEKDPDVTPPELLGIALMRLPELLPIMTKGLEMFGQMSPADRQTFAAYGELGAERMKQQNRHSMERWLERRKST